MCMAGLYDVAQFVFGCVLVSSSQGLHTLTNRLSHHSRSLKDRKRPLYSFTIITTDNNAQLSFLHDRMPVILSTPQHAARWLDTTSHEFSKNVASLLKPFDGELDCYRELSMGLVSSAAFPEVLTKRVIQLFPKRLAKPAKTRPNLSTLLPSAKETSRPSFRNSRLATGRPARRQRRQRLLKKSDLMTRLFVFRAIRILKTTKTHFHQTAGPRLRQLGGIRSARTRQSQSSTHLAPSSPTPMTLPATPNSTREL